MAQASLTFFATVVAPHASTGSLPEGLWLRAFAALERCAQSLASPNTTAHVSVRQSFVGTLAAVHAIASTRIPPDMYNTLILILDMLAAQPVSDSEKYPVGDVLPPVLVSIAAVLPALLPPHAPECWSSVVHFFCCQLRGGEDAAKVDDGDTGPGALARSTRRATVSLLWMEEMVKQLVTAVRSYPCTVILFSKLNDAFL